MTISSTNTKNSYSGDDSTVAFSYTFKILDADDIQVILRTNATGTETVQTRTTDYSVSGVGNAGGGTITFVSAPAATETVVLIRAIPLTQTTDYTPNDPFPAVTHEDALDKLTLMAQDTQEEVDRSIKLSRTNTMTSTEFTVGATTRANKIFAFDSSGELAVTQEIGTFQGDWAASTAYAERDLVKDTSTNNIFIVNSAHTSSGSQPLTTNPNSSKYDLIVDAAAATTSATNAASSATAAAASATAAAASESAAATSETNAAASEAGVAADAAAAAASAAAASTSESNASTSETNASNSASAAATSATNAATSATNASNSASAASTSETNAATSESNASDSADAASTSASNAASSASSASTSETNAASSASSAASDASAAATSAAAAAASFDAFDDIYLGAKASAPTVDNDGDALTEGDQYFNTTNNTLFVWNGSAWQAASPDIVGDTTPQLGGNLDTNGNNIDFGDSEKARFGNGPDLEVFHDGFNSYINEVGIGSLYLDTANGANVNITAGDGAESMATFAANGAATLFHDNTARLATTSSGIDVTGTAVTDGLTVDGNVSVDGGTIKLDGNYPTGSGNVALGNAALDDAGLSGGFNVAVGSSALGANTSGNDNTSLGTSSMSANTTGSDNTAVGRQALTANTTASNNTGVGYQALTANTTGANNTAVGYQSLLANTTGTQNVATGNNALLTNTTGIRNTGLGVAALAYNTDGDSNTAVGFEALQANTTANNNTAVGYQSLYANTIGTNNAGHGYRALYLNTEGSNNTALGAETLAANTTGANNTAVGVFALDAATTASNNDAFGYTALSANTTGSANVGIGSRALENNTTASANTAVGRAALSANTTGANNTSLGYLALTANTTGAQNTAVGANALDANQGSGNQTAVGYNALTNTNNSGNNTAVGASALAANTTASNNTAVGYQALTANTTGYSNVALGQYAGNSLTTGAGNCFVGQNTASGASGSLMTTGSKNTILGGYNGNQNGLDIRTSSNNIVLSDGDGNPRQVINSGGQILTGNLSFDGSRANSGTLCLNANTSGVSECQLQIKNPANVNGTNRNYVLFYTNGGTIMGSIQCNTTSTQYNTTSDYRLKQSVVNMTGAIDRVKALEPKRFEFIANAGTTVDGFLAHQAATVVPEAVSGTKDAVDADGNIDPQGIDQSKLVPLLTGALKEAITKIETLEARVAALESN